MVVGDVARRTSAAFAERYAQGRWTPMRIVGRYQSAFYDVSCPVTRYCVAVGVEHGSASLIEAWNGAHWAAQDAPRIRRPLNVNALLSVSCVSPKDCTAVGFRHNPRIKYSYRTLAVGSNGASWKIEPTFNQ